MTVVKICGITDIAGGVAAIDGGASYLGFVFYPRSTRLLTPDEAAGLINSLRAARPSGWQAVGVFVNEPLDRLTAICRVTGLDIVQLNGEETIDYIRKVRPPVFKALRIGGLRSADLPAASTYGATRLLVDASVPGSYGGSGVAYDWAEVRELVADGFLAGGLTPENVARAIAAARPWGVDVSSGVERNGRKDPVLIARFLAAVAICDQAVLS
jgi:phosphoribosylanthranilate isomerase